MTQKNNEIGKELHIVSHMLKRKLERSIVQASRMTTLSPSNGWILLYLYDHRDEDIYQKDIETTFNIRRSTVSQTIALMEEKGLIRRTLSDTDARLKKITLTEKGIETQQLVHSEIISIENKLSDALTQEEYDTFFMIMNKLKQVL